MLAQTPGEIGKIIGLARRHRGLTQAALAKAIGTSQAWISEVEKGKDSAHIGKVFRTLSYLGVRLRVDAGRWLGSQVIMPETGRFSLSGVIASHSTQRARKKPP